MNVRPQPTFMWKAFTSFTISLAFIVLVASGAVLFVAPAGRVANWSGWTFSLLARSDWQAVHTIFAAAFLVAAVVHLFYNWRVLLAYLRARAGGTGRWREVAMATAAVAAVLALTVARTAPVARVMALGEQAKASWSDGNEPPIPHAEILTLAKLADTTRGSLDAMLANATATGVQAGAETTLAEVSRQLGVTPAEAFTRLTAGQKRVRVPVAEGGGWGQKTVAQVCRQFEVPVDAGLVLLKQAGFDATANSNVRDLAQRHGRMPIEVVKALSPSDN